MGKEFFFWTESQEVEEVVEEEMLPRVFGVAHIWQRRDLPGLAKVQTEHAQLVGIPRCVVGCKPVPSITLLQSKAANF